MPMKKLAAAVLAVLLSGCASSPSDVSADAPAKPESSAEVSVTFGDDVPADPDIPGTPDEPDEPDEPDTPDTPDGADNSGLAFPDNGAGAMVKAALSTGEWSFMQLADAETAAVLVPGLSLDDCEEYCLTFCGMSTQLQYAFAVRCKPGSEAAVNAALESFFNGIKNNPDLAFYPAQQEAANGAVMGELGDYVYVVVHADGRDCADAMEAAQ